MMIAFDIKEMKPGCAIIQGMLGCDPLMASQFHSKHWLINLTPNMKVYEITKPQLDYLVTKVEAHHQIHGEQTT